MKAFSGAAALLALALLVHAAAATRLAPEGRQLLQVGGTCTTKIPACEASRCFTQLVDGVSSAVCERCLSGFRLTNKGLQCVCPRGRYATGTNDAPTCSDCGQGYYCPGGSMTARNSADAAVRGERKSCTGGGSATPVGLTTKSSRATKHTDCVALPGYAVSSLIANTQAATPCGPDTYNPGYNRLKSCLKCQSGLQEPQAVTDAVNANSMVRSNKLEVCQVPAGRFLSQNVVRPCPVATYRSTPEATNAANARICFPCPKGITTLKGGSTSFTDCNQVLPGYKVDSTWVTDQLSQSQSGLAETDPPMCDKGTYFEGGTAPTSTSDPATCTACPLGTTTSSTGATSKDECMVPPGYFVRVTGSVGTPTAGTLTKCPATVTIGSALPQGTFRAGWASWQDTSVRALATTANNANPTLDGVDACTKCGDGILVTQDDFDEKADAVGVATSSSSCYIAAGWGMIFNPSTSAARTNSNWTALPCPANTYGVSEQTFGLQQAPCKPCPRNTATIGVVGPATSYEQCKNLAGYGYTADGVNKCQEGFWAAAGTMLACTPCPAGRTTPKQTGTWDSTKQDEATDCVVKEGYGIYSNAVTDPWNPTPADNAAALALSAIECPVGYYSAGGAVGTKCTACTVGTTTVDQGTVGSGNTVCTKCAAGYGGGSGSCTACTFGKYQPGFSGVAPSGASPGAMGDGLTCLDCASTKFTYTSSTGNQAALDSSGMTMYTMSKGPEACVPRYQQLFADAGQIFKLPAGALAVDWTATTADACVTACQTAAASPSAPTACFAQFEYTAAFRDNEEGLCKRATLPAAADLAVTNVLLVKLIPSDPIAAASVIKGKAMSSGIYARLQGVANTEYGNLIGTTLTSTTEAACRASCDADSTCWAVLMASANSCTLRTGEDLLDARSFYVNPAPSATLQGLKW